MPIVTIQESSGRSTDERRRLVKAITESFVTAYGNSPDDVTILFQALSEVDLAKSGLLQLDRPRKVPHR